MTGKDNKKLKKIDARTLSDQPHEQQYSYTNNKRKFGGKVYGLFDTSRKKHVAMGIRDEQKAKGNLARVVPCKNGYNVFVCRE
jgi:hypothetical protein